MPTLLLIGAALIVLLKAWQGWRLGLVRQVVSLGALIVGAGVGILGAEAAAGVLRSVVPLPGQVLLVIGGFVLGGLVFATIAGGSAVLFKKTSDQGLAVVRIGFGLSGAAIGAVYGVVLVCMFAIALRLLGTVAETAMAVEKNRHLVPRASGQPHAVVRWLAATKRVLDSGAVGAVLRTIDPLPETTYATLGKLALLVANGKSIQRFLNYPGVRPAMDHPKVIALLSDPEVGRAIAERRYLALLTNANLVAASEDPDLAARLRAIDLEQALDFALRKPAAATPPPGE